MGERADREDRAGCIASYPGRSYGNVRLRDDRIHLNKPVLRANSDRLVLPFIPVNQHLAADAKSYRIQAYEAMLPVGDKTCQCVASTICRTLINARYQQ